MLWKRFELVQEPEEPVREEPESFLSPARDDAYDFTVTVHRTASFAGRPRSAGSWLDDQSESEHVRGLIREVARQITRRFSIFDPDKAESAVNEHIQRRLDEIAQGDRRFTLRWWARAEVSIPEEVRELKQQVAVEKYKIYSKAETKALQIVKTDELRLAWERFLAAVEKSPKARPAIQLAENPGNVTQVFTDMLAEQQKNAEQLLSVIAKITDSLQQADILDVIVNSETVLRRTLEVMGIPLPAMEQDTFLISVDEM
ncbi:hypothetical protein ACQP10_34790 [Streptosporangium sandarakinum]|uniref:hypothetical protein n=1 Tax=Streptosporangium sandarakinum TaxID=1260955 RepID=UPI003D8E7A5E